MINTLLISDDQDEHLGDFFSSCADKIQAQIEPKSQCLQLFSRQLNQFSIQFNIENFGATNFLFVSYTHGSESELLRGGVSPVLSSVQDLNYFRNGVAFCYACHCGKKLGPALIDNGALAFVGYNSEVKIQKYFGALDYFKYCATSVIIDFVNGDKLSDAFDKLKTTYTNFIDDYYLKDFLTASFFLEDRDSLVILGNKEIYFENLN